MRSGSPLHRRVLLDVRRLTEPAREAVDEREILTTLSAMLAELPGVTGVRVWPVDGSVPLLPDVARVIADADGRHGADGHHEGDGQHDGDGDGDAGRRRELLPVFARRTLVAVMAVDHDGSPDWQAADAETLASAASASLTARRSVRDVRTDVLTQALSRTALDETLREEVVRARRSGRPLSVVFLDLDRFKSVNDDLGHAAGDAVLREVAAALRDACRPYDHVARVGGDEFLVIAPETGAEEATVLAERLRHAVTARASAAVGRHVGCCAGVCEARPDLQPAELLDLADGALRAAKRAGRDRAHVVAGAPARAEPPGPTVTATPCDDLRQALAGDGLSTLFQPLRDLRTGVVIAYEALSRGPGRLERPDHLLAAATEADELVTLDERLRRQSFDAATRVGIRDPTTPFVNAERETLLAMADDAELWQRGHPPFPSITEVTERTLFAHPGRLLRACARLREHGWGIALDDLGQDPRSLALLPLLAPDVVKLDLRLLLDRPPVDTAMVTVAVTAHVQRSQAVVVAEGVEREEHRDRARALGATVGQGHFFGRPSAHPAAVDGVPGAVPQLPLPPALDGETPFEALGGDDAQLGPRALLEELQAHLERRALGMGPLATLTTVLPRAAGDRSAPGRLRHLARDVGLVALLHPDADTELERGFAACRLEVDHPLADEWVTVVTCPHYAMTLVARPADPAGERWRFRLDHDVDTGLRAARAILLALG